MKFHVERHRFRIRFSTVFFLLFALGMAQQPVLPTSFEIASVKRSPSNQGMTSVSPWGSDTFSVKNASLEYLLQLAFGKPPYLITGEPEWIHSEAYDVEAKTPGRTLNDWRAARDPLQNLLRERFQLKTHFEQNLVSGYALVSAKTGPKLKPVEGGISSAYVTPGRVYGQYISLEGVAYLLTSAVGRPVVDQTGIKGFYDIDIWFAASTDSALPDLFSAVQEQLGLRPNPQSSH